jgi:hypothetical protein
VSAILTIGPNHLPVANPDAVIRVPGDVLKIVKAKLTANDYDPDPGDPIAIISWSPFSANGASIQTDATGLWLYYVPVSGSLSNSNDSFTYTIADGNGGTASTTVYVLVSTSDVNAIPKNIISASFNTDGSLNLRFIGIAGKSYYIQGSPTLITPNWLTLGTVTAQDSGFIDFVDAEAGTYANRFYRAVIVP